MESALQDLLKILVCPRCHGDLVRHAKASGLYCAACSLIYPIQDGIPVLLEEEAYPVQSERTMPSQALKTAIFEVLTGDMQGQLIKLPLGTCRAIGRSLDDPQQTQVFSGDFALTLDDVTKKLIDNYLQKKTDAALAAARGEGPLGRFKRLPDLMLPDSAISRLHAMIFHDESGAGILDLVSRNGTFVNGKEVESRSLQEQDKVEVGNLKLKFYYQSKG